MAFPLPSSTHGARRSYLSGCRCVACRAANAAYVNAHRSPTGLVPADAAAAHLQQLAALGIGYRSVAHSAGVSPSVVQSVRAGTSRLIRSETANRLLATPAALAPSALTPATTSWRFIDSLEREGFTRRELAWNLGNLSQQLQFAKRRIRQSSAHRIQRLYARLADT